MFAVAIQFTNEVFAHLAPLASLLPILIHLLAMRRKRPIRFTMVHLLERAVLQAHGMRKLREWLIVVLRSLAFLFLFLALSRPVIKAHAFGRLIGDAEVCMLIDNTMSMAFVDGEESRFERAIKGAAELVRSLPQADFLILPISESVKMTRHRFTRAAEALQRLTEMRIKKIQGSPTQAIIEAVNELKLVDSATKHLLIFTDGQTVQTICSDLRRLKGSLNERECGARISITLIDVRKKFWDVNIAAVDWDVSVAPLSSPQSAILKVCLRNYGSSQWRGALSVTVDGELVTHIKDVVIGSREKRTLAIPLSLGGSGWHVGNVLWQDALQLDNQLHFAFYNPVPLRVFCIGSEQHGGTLSFLMKVLESVRDSIGSNSIVIGKGRALSSSLEELSRWHVLIWCNWDKLSWDTKSSLRDWLSSGGTLIIFLEQSITRLPLFPEVAIKRQSRGEPYRIIAPDISHPLIQRLPNEHFKGVLIFRRSIASSLIGDPILQFDDGVPALTETKFGFGRIFTFWFGADRDGSTLPTSPIFVPLICELLRYAIEQSHKVLKVVGEGGVRIEQRGSPLLSSTAIVSNVDVGDSDTRIPNPMELRKLASSVGMEYIPLDEWYKRYLTEVLFDVTSFFIILCATMLLIESSLRVLWAKPKLH